MKVVVIGGGAWGLPAAAELVARGHEVHLVDRYGVGNALSSSRGPSRIWRLGDTDPWKVRMSRRALDSMRRLQSFSEHALFGRQGMLWRHPDSNDRLILACVGEGVEAEPVPAEEVGKHLPGLQPDGRDAVHLPEAGAMIADRILATQLRRVLRNGGRYSPGREVATLEDRSWGPRVCFADGAVEDVDAAVVTAGPGAAAFLEQLGLPAVLHTYLEQVAHFAGADGRPTDAFPALFDGYGTATEGIYAMPSVGIGYKVGIDAPVRDLDLQDDDRTPDGERTAAIRRRVERSFTSLEATVLDAQLCTWTDTPDGRFVLDVTGNGIVLGCGDAGEGFKYSPLMGEILADLVENRPRDGDVAACSLDRFALGPVGSPGRPTRLGEVEAPG